MAAGTDVGGSLKRIFSGSKVSCTTYHGEKIEGEVLAFDTYQNILILRLLPSTCGTKGTCNINFINAELLQEFAIIGETKKHTTPLLSIDMEKVIERHQTNLEKRQKAVERIGVGVSSVGQMLFDTINKQYSCYWENTNISVKDIRVTVTPPYKPENCKGDTKAIDQIKKLVEKFHDEQITSTPT